MNNPGPSSSHPPRRPSTSSQPTPTADALDNDPFVASTPPANLYDPFRPSITSYYDDPDPIAYPSNPHACDTSTSPIFTSGRDSGNESSSTSSTVDDSTHLTATLNTTNMNPNNRMDVAAVIGDHDHDDWRTDSEQHILLDDISVMRRRLQHRYGALRSPSPIRGSGTAINWVSEGLRRASLRVVNFSGATLYQHVRLPDGDDQVDATGDGRRRPSPDNDEDGDYRPMQLLSADRASPLRGWSLWLFGPTSRVRRVMYDFLIFPCVFPVYLRSCAHLSDGSPHTTDGQNLSFFVRLFLMPSC